MAAKTNPRVYLVIKMVLDANSLLYIIGERSRERVGALKENPIILGSGYHAPLSANRDLYVALPSDRSVAQMVKNPLTKQETWARFLGR